MRRIVLIWGLLLLGLLACRAVVFGAEPRVLYTPTSLVSATAPASPTRMTPVQEATPVATATPEAPYTDAPQSAQTPQPAGAFDLRVHPDGGLFVGDQVSLEVIAPPGVDLSGQELWLQAPGEQEPAGPFEFGAFGLARRSQATLFWAWDTSGLQAGDYTLTFSIDPSGPTWTETVSLAPASALPPPEPGARWAHAENDCCLLYYLTGSEAERDLQEILDVADAQAADVSHRMQASFDEPITLVMLARVLGHGGFANDEISVSYLDRNYAGDGLAIVLHHEMVHVLDARLGGELRPSLFVEGLAVYLSGGHFKPEALMPRATALLELGWYLPLQDLADDFYPSQHETGYLQAGALVEYMVERWGWEAFNRFYRDIHPDPQGGGQAASIDNALLRHFDLSFSRLEADFQDALRAQPVDPDAAQDVRISIAFYDTMRRYQRLLDPSAYYLTAWLPNGAEMRERGIVADFLRRPSAPANIALEDLLVAADARLRAGDYALAERLLEAVNAALDAIIRG